MRCNLNGGVLDYHIGYQEDDALRAAFNRLAMETFALDFEPWYRQGFWTDAYQPHTLFDGGRAVANVSASELWFRLGERTLHCVQLGTVMTAPADQNRGLSRWLMERVLAFWRGRCDFVYLYANDSVLDFYPRFGFRKAQEYQDIRPLRRGVPCAAARKKHISYKLTSFLGRGVPCAAARRLDPGRPEDCALLLRCCRQYGNPFSALSMARGEGLLMFYAIGPLRGAFYYLEEWDAVAVAAAENGALCCEELFAPAGTPLDAVLSALAQTLAGPGVHRVRFGFSLKEAFLCEKILLEEPDTTLFVLPAEENIFDRARLRFPALSHA